MDCNRNKKTHRSAPMQANREAVHPPPDHKNTPSEKPNRKAATVATRSRGGAPAIPSA